MFKSFDVGSMPLDAMIAREWLATNGIGGYASSTIPGLNTRKYHGLLVAAMAPPVRRMVLLSRLDETLRCDGWPHALSSNEYPGAVHPQGYHSIKAFSSDPFPRWAYQGENWTLQKELCLLKGENTVCITYTLLAGYRPVSLEVRPVFALRPIHELSFQWDGRLLAESQCGQSHRIPATARTPEAFFSHTGSFDQEPNWYLNTIYRREQERGYSALEDVWSPGVIRFELNAGDSAHFVCSADPHDFHAAVEQSHRQGATTRLCAMTPLKLESKPEPVKTGVPVKLAVPLTGDEAVLSDLTRAADQFVVKYAGEDGKARVSSMSMYPWSPPSGRSALAGFTGLFLIPGKFEEARLFLIGMAAQLDRGLLPTDFPENGSAPLYLGADVSLWFVNAVYAYLRYTRDDATVNSHLLDPVLRIVEQYRRGTRLGISTDANGLLKTYSPGVATTWMNAKVGDWVITPRQGRPVEINALWYNAVCIAGDLVNRFGSPAGSAEDLSELSRGIKVAFNQRFWNVRTQCCNDVVGDRAPDATIRPNQLLAMSLPFPVLSLDLHMTALARVMAELATPLGVRTLSPNDPGYVGRYSGNVVSRDRATHGGSAFPWLLGPLVTAYVRVNGRGEGARREARELLQDCIDHIQGDGLGQMPELFDGDVPHTPGGAIASALSIAEILRAFFEDVLDRVPHYPSDTTVRPENVIEGIRSTPLRGQ